MKTIYKISLFLLTVITLASCEADYKFAIKVQKKATLNDKVAVSLTEDDKYYYCSLDKEHAQLTNFFPPEVMPQHMNMEAVTKKDDEEEEETGYYY